MSVAAASPASAARGIRRARPFTVEEFYRLAQAGILGPNHQRLELIAGAILEPIPIGALHASAVTRISSIFSERLGQRFTIRSQNPVRLSEFSEPLPDITLLNYRADFYRNAHPTPSEVVLLIEVADTTLEFDTGDKARMYAEAGI